jgi:hypothetical protein
MLIEIVGVDFSDLSCCREIECFVSLLLVIAFDQKECTYST